MRPTLAALALLLVSPGGAALPGAAALRRLDARYAPVDLRVDLSGLAEGDRRALAKLVAASRVLDALYLRQVWAGNEPLLLSLAADGSPLGRARLAFFLRNKGPWDRLDRYRAFVPGVPAKPPEANFYPAGATREEVAAWASALPAEERARAMGFFTVLRRDPAGRIAVVPYSLEYQGELAEAARLLREAAALTPAPTLRAFLEKRAAAFLSDDYRESDVAWMRLDSSVEPTIGPYEVYEDEWFNAKAAFEAFVCVRDEGATRRLARLGGELQDIEDHLPIEDAWKNPRLGALAPIRVVNVLFAAGDAMHGVQTAAFNLPNDERVVQEMGSKRVMLKNVEEAKFEKVLRPIARRVLDRRDQARVSFDAFFTHILAHELMHGLGPHRITVAGRATTVRAELEDLYSGLEEAKADVAGVFALRRLAERGAVDRAVLATLPPTFVASLFRSLAFGLAEPHARGVALQVAWLVEHGAVAARPDGTFAVDEARFWEAATSLTREIMTVQARGDRAAARALLDRGLPLPAAVERALRGLEGVVPVDIAPRFVTAEALAPP